jgi:hypothetical protein
MMNGNQPSPAVPRSSFIVHHSSFLLRLLVFAVTFLVFSRLIPCNFTWWDDQDTIRQNPRLNSPTWAGVGYYWTNAGEHTTMGLYVPVTYTVWSGLALVAHCDRPDGEGLMLNAWVFHAANVFIHACTAVVVFQLLLRLLGNDSGPRSVRKLIAPVAATPASPSIADRERGDAGVAATEKAGVRLPCLCAALGALVFAIHPVQVESVGWISGTKDLLCGLLSVSALLMYVRSVQLNSPDARGRWPGRWRYLLGILFFVLAMLSKPTAVVVPLMAAVIGVFLLDLPIRRVVLTLLPWFLLMIPCLIWTQKVQPAEGSNPVPVWVRPAVAADAIAFYLCKLVWPIHLCIDYGHNPRAIIASHLICYSWILPAIVAVVLWRRYTEHRPAIAAALLFLLPLGPILGLVPFEFQLISTTSDHYLYLPMVGVGLFVAWAIKRFEISNGIVVILIGLGIRSLLQEPTWQDTRSLFLHALAVNPRSVASFDGLGFVTGRDARQLSDAGRNAEARPLFDESIDWYRKSLAYEPESVPSMLNLALDYQKIGRTDLGLEQIHRMVQVQPSLPEGLRADPITLAHLLSDFGDIPGMIAWLDDVLRRDPGNINAAVLRERAIEHLPKDAPQRRESAKEDANQNRGIRH